MKSIVHSVQSKAPSPARGERIRRRTLEGQRLGLPFDLAWEHAVRAARGEGDEEEAVDELARGSTSPPEEDLSPEDLAAIKRHAAKLEAEGMEAQAALAVAYLHHKHAQGEARLDEARARAAMPHQSVRADDGPSAQILAIATESGGARNHLGGFTNEAIEDATRRWMNRQRPGAYRGPLQDLHALQPVYPGAPQHAADAPALGAAGLPAASWCARDAPVA